MFFPVRSRSGGVAKIRCSPSHRSSTWTGGVSLLVPAHSRVCVCVCVCVGAPHLRNRGVYIYIFFFLYIYVLILINLRDGSCFY